MFTEEDIINAFLAGFEESAEGWNAEYGCIAPNDRDYLKKKAKDYIKTVKITHTNVQLDIQH